MFEMNRRVFQASQFNGRIGFEVLTSYATAGAMEVFNALKAPKVISKIDSAVEGEIASQNEREVKKDARELKGILDNILRENTTETQVKLIKQFRLFRKHLL